MKSSKLIKTDFRGSTFLNSDLSDSDIRDTNFEGSYIKNTKFARAIFSKRTKRPAGFVSQSLKWLKKKFKLAWSVWFHCSKTMHRKQVHCICMQKGYPWAVVHQSPLRLAFLHYK